MADDKAATEPHVKSLTFTTLRSFLPKHFEAEELETVLGRLEPATRTVLETAEPGEWVPEARMHDVMDAVYDGALQGDDEAFLVFARALAHEGIGRFMRVILSLASPRFVLRKIPVVWNRLRRDAGKVVADSDGDLVRLRYEDFPFFRYRVYRLLSLANCQALVEAATGRRPAGRIAAHTGSTMLLEFDLSAMADVDAG